MKRFFGCAAVLGIAAMIVGCDSGTVLDPSAGEGPAVLSRSAGPVLETKRPLADFLSVQGTYEADVSERGGHLVATPDGAILIGWFDPKADVAAVVDYAALTRDYLARNGTAIDTRISGEILEHPLADGRAEVRVSLTVRNALAWAVDGANGFDGAPRFGYRPEEIQWGDITARAALAEARLEVVFINDEAGGALPDLAELFDKAAHRDDPDWGGDGNAPRELLSVTFRAKAGGALRGNSVGGQREIRSGTMVIDQVSEMSNPAQFRVEHVAVRARNIGGAN